MSESTNSSPNPGGSAPSPQGFADPIEEKIIRRIPFEIAAVSAILGLAFVFVFAPLAGLFFFGGGLLSALSFIWMKNALARVLNRGKVRALWAGVALYAVRFLLIFGIFFLIILLYPKTIIAFAAGFSTVIPVFAGETAVALARAKSMKPWNN